MKGENMDLDKIIKIYLTPFEFNGKIVSLDMMREWKQAKVYTTSSHFDRILFEDQDGDLYLYEFYEHEDWNNGNDEIYTTYVPVKDESEADMLNKQGDIRRIPYLRVMPDYELVIK
jgi:hypothetical protein